VRKKERRKEKRLASDYINAVLAPHEKEHVIDNIFRAKIHFNEDEYVNVKTIVENGSL